jgi:alpha-beta hydrolase superfamily lysophospholipase
MRKFFIAIAAAALLLCASLAQAADLKGWGAVVMHGKGSYPGLVAGVASALSAGGAAVVTPTMSWASGYVTYDQALDEVAGHIASLRGRGATRIALVGHSLGANVALGYAARRGGVAAVAAIAPGHQPGRIIDRTRDSLQRAKAAVAAGRGGEVGSYTDVNQGNVYAVRTSASAYVSFFDPAGPALIGRNAARLRGARLLWVVGTGDPGAQRVARGGKVITVTADHVGTLAPAATHVVSWLGAQ